MTDHFGLEIRQTSDWTNLSKIVIRTCNRDLLNSLIQKTADMSGNGFGKVIFNFGATDSELRIFSRLGTAMAVLDRLLEGQDFGRLSAESTIQAIN